MGDFLPDNASDWLHWIDLLGVAVFAISGTLMAHKKHMDGIGVIVLATVTAIGGGTLRDLILDVPVFWVSDNSYLYAILLAALITIIWIRRSDRFPLRFLLHADAIGLAFFNIMGAQKALSMGVSPVVAVMMGTMSGVFGGLLRDVICREIPLVLKGELYATACIIGGILYTLCLYVGMASHWSMAAGILVTLTIRLLAMRYHWQLTVFHPPTNH
ncbi:trimeric intracellular cation channel family protein [Bowmanella sp. JS7-9]|uniref:Trimeric intracellular cation channel family protein n=1 Tax=Pseudobowmanella zhangzhouensis TaxID=1537679 RepID=A0ABW1XN60_9ALTE|nr:trimeric intracellular cation channel family protein [Bowmanella sp. JS7-9]TBX24445.1 membrane protein [Bowmanella sp. JS7-9]